MGGGHATMRARHPCNAARLHAPETQNKNAQMAAKLDQHSYSSHSKTRELMILTETLRVFDMFPLLQITFHPKIAFHPMFLCPGYTFLLWVPGVPPPACGAAGPARRMRCRAGSGRPSGRQRVQAAWVQHHLDFHHAASQAAKMGMAKVWLKKQEENGQQATVC